MAFLKDIKQHPEMKVWDKSIEKGNNGVKEKILWYESEVFLLKTKSKKEPYCLGRLQGHAKEGEPINFKECEWLDSHTGELIKNPIAWIDLDEIEKGE